MRDLVPQGLIRLLQSLRVMIELLTRATISSTTRAFILRM